MRHTCVSGDQLSYPVIIVDACGFLFRQRRQIRPIILLVKTAKSGLYSLTGQCSMVVSILPTVYLQWRII